MRNIPLSTKILGAAFISMSLTALWLTTTDAGYNTLAAQKKMFVVADSGIVSKVCIEKGKSKINLFIHKYEYKLNDSLLADYELASNLMMWVYQAQINDVGQDDIKHWFEKNKNNVAKISYYVGNEPYIQFIALPDTANNQCIWAKSDDDSQIYKLSLAGSDRDILPFTVSDMNDWRSKILFSSIPKTIKNIQVLFKASPKDNFEIYRENGKYFVKNMPQADSVKILSYLYLYKKVTIHQFIQNKPLKDSLVQLQPQYEIALKDINDTYSNRIGIYYNPQSPKIIYGLINDNTDLVVIKPAIYEYLLQKRSFFEGK
ncbi:MAG: hypothetical protein NW207_11715 [Cytophagales bacterium]|nr:hypothetical protein [Cytophagales bacterium]